MPELPEVEVICRGLQKHVVNKRIIDFFYSGKKLRLPLERATMHRELVDQRISGLSRRAKYLLLEIKNGAVLIIHLGMTGNMGIFKKNSLLKKHDHACWTLENGTELRFNDTRRFGAIQLLPKKNAKAQLQRLFATTGPEPFSRTCSSSYLIKRAANRKQAIKCFIMDNHVIAGIGNIYANESLFRSGIHPARSAASLDKDEWKRLLMIIRKTLKHAIECGGSTISDFVDASGKSGYFQMNFQIYGKAGEQCRRCNDTIQKSIIGGRASFFCPTCQVEDQIK